MVMNEAEELAQQILDAWDDGLCYSPTDNDQGDDMLDFILKYESGEANTEEIIAGFSELVKSGAAWSLQGHYGRTASALIEAGHLDNEGNILSPFGDLLPSLIQ